MYENTCRFSLFLCLLNSGNRDHKVFLKNLDSEGSPTIWGKRVPFIFCWEQTLFRINWKKSFMGTFIILEWSGFNSLKVLTLFCPVEHESLWKQEFTLYSHDFNFVGSNQSARNVFQVQIAIMSKCFWNICSNINFCSTIPSRVYFKSRVFCLYEWGEYIFFIKCIAFSLEKLSKWMKTDCNWKLYQKTNKHNIWSVPTCTVRSSQYY